MSGFDREILDVIEPGRVIGDAWYPIESAPADVWVRVREMSTLGMRAIRHGSLWYGRGGAPLGFAPRQWALLREDVL